jgi:hypothetical protein
MNNSYDPHSYNPSDFDEEMCLKPPVLLWVVVLYLSRGIALPIAVGIGHVLGIDTAAMAALRGFWKVDDFVPALVAIPVLYALFRRTSKASRTVRWLWTNGRILLAAAAAIDIALSISSLLPFAELGDQAAAAICGIVMDAYFIIYILKARRVRDTFSDFPPQKP